ncbi:hypothetical protein CCACVL1_22152, partial [Corchorus capsularis]
ETRSATRGRRYIYTCRYPIG